MTTASVPLKTGAGSLSLISLAIAGNCAAIRRIDQTPIHRQAKLSIGSLGHSVIRLRMATAGVLSIAIRLRMAIGATVS
jgi:hypothetical protein